MSVHTATREIRLALVDDHLILRQGLRSVLEREDDLVVVGDASSEPEPSADRTLTVGEVVTSVSERPATLFSCVGQEALPGEVDGDERGRARGLDVEGRTAEVQPVGDPGGQEGGAEHPQPDAPRRRQHRGRCCGHPESAGRESGI